MLSGCRRLSIALLNLVAFSVAGGLLMAACRERGGDVDTSAGTHASPTQALQLTTTSDAGVPPWPQPSRMAPPSKGMVWIPPGALVAGTPPEVVPRKADREMRGEQVMLDGFYIDEYAFPNEQGAIPTTGVTQAEASALCEERDKRLCSELEWERACKGPQNFTYAYGNVYAASICGTGGPSRPLPAGYRFGCRSEFGVHDLHGSLWEWTASRWGRGSASNWIAQRGGNGADGEVVARCANARSRAPNTREADVGFRCCSGPKNEAEVALDVEDEPTFRRVINPERTLLRELDGRIPAEVAQEMRKRGLFRMVHLWEWRPVANEHLLAAGGCAGVPESRRCGVLVVRRTLGRLDPLGWVSSGRLIPTLKIKYDPLRLWVYGADLRSHFRVPVDFEWGAVKIGEPVRNTKKQRRAPKKR